MEHHSYTSTTVSDRDFISNLSVWGVVLSSYKAGKSDKEVVIERTPTPAPAHVNPRASSLPIRVQPHEVAVREVCSVAELGFVFSGE